MPRRYGLRSVNGEEFLISGCADAVNGQAASVQDTRAVFRDDCVASAFLRGHLCDHGELAAGIHSRNWSQRQAAAVPYVTLRPP